MKGEITQVPIIQQYLLLTYVLLIQIWQIVFVFYLEQRNHILIHNLNFFQLGYQEMFITYCRLTKMERSCTGVPVMTRVCPLDGQVLVQTLATCK